MDNIDAADTVLDDIAHQFKRLASQPKMGRARPELAEDLRSFPVARYVIFYVPTVDGIEVVRVLHGARDIPEAFGDE